MQIKFSKPKNDFKKKGAPNPDMYWKLIVCVTSLILFSSFVFGYYSFQEVNKEENITPSTDIEQQKKRTERLEKVLEYFGEREKKSEELLNSPSPVVDPSL